MNIPRDTPLKKAIYACDELVGFIGACVKVRPDEEDRGPAGRPRSSKKLKDKAFARSVDRSYVYGGAEAVGRPPRGAHRVSHRVAQAHRRRDRPLNRERHGICYKYRVPDEIELSVAKGLAFMSTVEAVSARTIRARSILKDLSGEELRALAASGEKTTEYGSPRLRDAHQEPLGQEDLRRLRRRRGRHHAAGHRRRPRGGEDPRGPGSSLEDGPDPGRPAHGHEPRGSDPLPPLRSQGLRPHRVHVAQHAVSVGLLEGARLHLRLRPRLAGDPDLPGRQPGLHLHPRNRLPRRGQEVDAPAGDVLDQAPGRARAARRVEDPARHGARREAARRRASCSSGSRGPGRRR